MYTTENLIEKVLEDAEGDYTAALLALEDGAYLALIGAGDEDGQAVDNAYAAISKLIWA